MSFPFFHLCAFIALIPLVLALNIRLDSTPIGFHNTSVSLRWTQDDPSDFILGAFLIHTKESVMVTRAMQPVENFTENRTTYMTFNYTSLPGKRDCILLAWLPDSNAGHHFAQSQVFSVTDPEATKSKPISSISSTSSVSRTALHRPGTTVDTAGPVSTTSESTNPSSPTPGTAPPVQSTTNVVPIETIVGIVIGSFSLLSSIVLALLIWRWRNRQKAKESAPSRAFWRSLNKKSPPASQTLPAYTPTVPLSSMELDESCFHRMIG
ncbi:uncharacterized protein ARMOST_07978 [Armillaria ostoyae]|uniref:Mid2 domain-containing protein n=1 Tax=Armillaria ostoyae TaxID=47428 RepID=A0A284R7D2_ARMOS|nr:uncharacterized protein ARMOST_07978 [Armillaria ostoyae]